jgi:ubiquinol-cytochrome c reductase cytochrome c subunit
VNVQRQGKWGVALWLMVATLVVVLLLSLLAAPMAGSQEVEHRPAPPRSPVDDPATRLVDDDPAAVARIYASDCAGCHGLQGEGTDFAPPVAGLGAAANYFWVATGRMPIRNVDKEIRRRPPRYGDDTAAALSEYIAGFGTDGLALPSLDPEGADLTNGARVYRERCAMCHMAAGRGGALLGDWAPSLIESEPMEVATAARIGIGTMPVFGVSEIDDEALNDVVAYAQYLREPDAPGGRELGFFGPRDETLIVFVFGLGVLVAFAVWINRREPTS